MILYICCNLHEYTHLHFDRIILRLKMSGPDHYFCVKPPPYLTCFLFKLCDIRRPETKHGILYITRVYMAPCL